MTAAPATPASMQRSHGTGALAVKAVDGRTRIARLHQSGNAKIRVPRTHGEALEAVLINTSGGVTGGDTLSWRIEAGANTRSVVTTQACERIYRSTGETGLQTTEIAVAEDACLFWLPQETILFDGGRFRRTLDVSLAKGARLVALESLVFGREAMGETVAAGFFHDRWRIRREGHLIHADDLRFDIRKPLDPDDRAVLAGNRATATLVAVLPDSGEELDRLVTGARHLLRDADAGASRIGEGADGGASRIGEGADGKITVRIAAPSSYALRKRLLPVLALFLDRGTLPKVWSL